jgi:WD40 repeat protein
MTNRRNNTKGSKRKLAGKIILVSLLIIIVALTYYQLWYKPKEINSEIFLLDKTFTGHTSDVWAAKFSPDGNLFASGSVDSTVRIYKLSGELIRVLHQSEGITNFDFSRDGKYIATCSYDGNVRLWTVNGDLLKTLKYGKTVWAVSFSVDNKTLAAAGEENNIKIWNIESGSLLATLNGHKANIWSVKFSNDGSKIITGSFDKTIKIWNAHTFTLINTLTAHRQAIVDLAISADNKTFASASDDKTIKIWNINTGQLMQSLQGGDEHVQGIAYSPDGQWLISSGRDKTAVGEFLQNIFGDSHFNTGVSMRLWDMQTHQVIQTFSHHANDVNDVAFSPDGNLILSASSDKTVCLWKRKFDVDKK